MLWPPKTKQENERRSGSMSPEKSQNQNNEETSAVSKSEICELALFPSPHRSQNSKIAVTRPLVSTL